MRPFPGLALPVAAIVTGLICVSPANAQVQNDASRAMGPVKIDGVWVEQEHVLDAAKNIYHHKGELVTRDELAALQGGKVRHPRTGMLIDEENLEKALDGLFPIEDEKWVSLEEANQYHSSMEHPWVYRSGNATLVGTMALQDMYDGGGWVDAGYELVSQLLQTRLSPLHRPVVVLAANTDQYKEFGNSWGGPDTSSGIFVSKTPLELVGISGAVQPTFVHYGEEAWRAYWVRHAGGLAYVEGICRDIGVTAPDWFKRGLGSYAGRHATLSISGWFGRNNAEVPDDVEGWFRSFNLGGNDRNKIDYDLYQAGLMVRFATDEEWQVEGVPQLWRNVVELFQKARGKEAIEAIETLEKSYYDKREELTAYLRFLITR